MYDINDKYLRFLIHLVQDSTLNWFVWKKHFLVSSN